MRFEFALVEPVEEAVAPDRSVVDRQLTATAKKNSSETAVASNARRLLASRPPLVGLGSRHGAPPCERVPL